MFGFEMFTILKSLNLFKYAISSRKETVEWIAIIVSKNGIEKLLGALNITRAKEKEQTMTCILSINDWKLSYQVQVLVFDTTASITSLQKGTCTINERVLKRELFWIAFLHHILKIVLSCVCNILFGPTSGPKGQSGVSFNV